MSSAEHSMHRVNDPPTGDAAGGTAPDQPLEPELQRILFKVAESSIARMIQTAERPEIDPECYPAPLREQRATFVTLRVKTKLRGCMGSLAARAPLVVDVATNAVAAATRDPRFPPVNVEELPLLDIHLSILSPPEPLPVTSEAELLQLMRPGIDGFILQEGDRRGTLLPSVWENVASPAEFLMHLKRKAGLAKDYWSKTICVERYTALSLHKPVD